MSPTPTKPQEQTEREKLIEQLRAQVEQAERRGHFDTAHHDMLKQLTQKPELTKESE